MSEHGGKTYRPWTTQCYQQEAHSPASKLPRATWFFSSWIPCPSGMYIACMRLWQETRGAPPFDPAMMVACC